VSDEFERAAVCMAFGSKARAEARVLARSVPVPLTVVGDEPVPGCDWREWQGESPFDSGGGHNFQFRAGRVKPYLHEYVDADHVLYLDTDCRIVGPLDAAWEALESRDLLVAEHPAQLCSQLYNKPKAGWYHNRREARYTGSEWGTLCIPYWNSGVIFWRQGEAMRRVFAAWSAEWRRFAQWDEQLALMRAVYAHPVRLMVLPVGWNAPHSHQAEAVFHWYGRGTSRTDGARDG
jgi:hypothetical protein